MKENRTAKNILKGFDKAKADRVTWESTWEDLVYYGMPRKRGIQSFYEPGDRLQSDVYDSTASQSNMILAAGLSGYMTNASQRWFELRARNEQLMRDKEVRGFFDDTSEVLYAAFANSNFYQQIHETYLDMGSIGTGTLYEEEDPEQDVRFYARPPKEIYAIENQREVVDTVYRKFELTAYQAYKLFGDKECGEVIRKAVLETKDWGKKFDFVHFVTPRPVRDVTKQDSRNMAFASYWVSIADTKIVKEGGYEEFPFNVTRFYKNSGDAYGYGPCFLVFPEVLMINRFSKIYIESAEVGTYPPWLLESDGIIGTLDLRSAALNYQRQPLSQGVAVQSLVPKADRQIAIEFLNRTEDKIKAAYFTDLFLMLTQNYNMTATEVIERTQEKMLMLGPVLGRLQTELLNPVVKRTFNILLRRGKLPRVPQKLINEEYDVVYVSPLAKAQRAAQAKDMNTFIAIIGQMAQMIPEALDTIDVDRVVDKLSKIYAIDPEILRGEEEVASVREQRAKAAQQQAMVQNMANAAQIGKTGSEMERNVAITSQQGKE